VPLPVLIQVARYSAGLIGRVRPGGYYGIMVAVLVLDLIAGGIAAIVGAPAWLVTLLVFGVFGVFAVSARRLRRT
jgi:hypothetical protein